MRTKYLTGVYILIIFLSLSRGKSKFSKLFNPEKQLRSLKSVPGSTAVLMNQVD